MKQLGAITLALTLILPNTTFANLHGSIFFVGEIVEVPCVAVNNNNSVSVHCNRTGEKPKTLKVNLAATKEQHIDGIKVNTDNIGEGLYTVTLTIA